MKRSRVLKLAVLGTVGALSGCEGDRPALVYPTVEACTQAGVLSAEDCRSEHERALANHVQTAPRFSSQADCERDFGPGQCQAAPQGGGFFVPLMMGYMIASMQRDQAPVYRGGSYYSQPLYRTRSDGTSQWRTAGNDVVKGTGPTRVKSSASVPQTRAVTMSRSGFGSTSSARGSWGS